MTTHRSLSFRLVLYLLIAQLVALASIPFSSFVISVSGLNPGSNMSWNDWGEFHARDLVINSLVQAPDGSIFIEPSPELRAYGIKNPGFLYAAFDRKMGAALPGSSAELVAALGSMSRVQAWSLRFHIAGDPNEDARGSLRMSSSPAGELFVAVYGYSFGLTDLLSLAEALLAPPNILAMSPLILGTAFIAWLLVRRGLKPLRVAADEASRIDMDRLDQRIPESGMPAEVIPLIDAVNEALERLDAGVAAQRRFTANAAHELRTPIAILRARLENPDDGRLKEELKRDVRRIQTIVEQLLIVARISDGESRTDQQIDLGDTILEMVADYMPLVIENRRRIEYEPPSSPVLARGNRRALESIMANLIDNALRAEPEGGVVIVRVSDQETIDVVDHGEGVCQEDREMIFEPFWRKSDATVGTGLGLAIAKELMDKLGGRIWVESTPGGGATFKISFPKMLRS